MISNCKKEEIQARFQELFQAIITDAVEPSTWSQADIVFKNGKKSSSFEDVEFLMASQSNGASLLYSSQDQGSSVYSVIGNGSKVSFSIR